MYFKIIIYIFTSIFWPLNLNFANSFDDFFRYTVPALLLLLSFFLHKKNNMYFVLPILTIPFVEPKLTIFPVIFTLFNFAFTKRVSTLIYFVISILIFISSFNLFSGQTIFVSDYEAKQQVVRDTRLYPSIFLARTFHNKARIIADKFTGNFFALTDPNNYFFGFHPRQLIGSQNLAKYPFVTLIPFLYGLYYITKNKNKEFIGTSVLSSLIALSTLTNFDRNDFILWFPIFLVIVAGVTELAKNDKLFRIYFVTFVVLIVPEVIRIFIK